MNLQIISEAEVYLTARGFIPVLRVVVDDKKTPRLLSISAKSISYPLNEMRSDNAGNFKGLRFELRKAGARERLCLNSDDQLHPTVFSETHTNKQHTGRPV